MKDIPGFEDLYACDTEGKIYSLPKIVRRDNGWNKIVDFHFPLKELRSYVRKDGYRGVSLRKDSKSKSMLVHRILGITFLGLGDDKEINHKDGNKDNNKLYNLEICSRGENVRHAFRTGLRNNKGSNHPLFFITEELKAKVRILIDAGIPQRKISLQLGLNQCSISKIKLNKL